MSASLTITSGKVTCYVSYSTTYWYHYVFEQWPFSRSMISALNCEGWFTTEYPVTLVIQYHIFTVHVGCVSIFTARSGIYCIQTKKHGVIISSGCVPFCFHILSWRDDFSFLANMRKVFTFQAGMALFIFKSAIPYWDFSPQQQHGCSTALYFLIPLWLFACYCYVLV